MRFASLMKTDMPPSFEHAASLFQLTLRCYVSWVFLKSGLLKISDWDSTLALFDYEYRVPVLSPHLAAFFGTAGELVFPIFLMVGLFGRLSALGLLFVNVLAVVAYQHVLLQEGFEAAIAQHYLWGLMLAVLVIYGPGRLSADALMTRFIPAASTRMRAA